MFFDNKTQKISEIYLKMINEGMNPIATTILNQIGGNKFIAMVGANNMVYDTNSLSFKFKMFPKANYLKIKLESNDTYTMTFMKITPSKFFTVKEFNMVYADKLASIFSDFTGLRTHL
jgi:hypothetical protein